MKIEYFFVVRARRGLSASDALNGIQFSSARVLRCSTRWSDLGPVSLRPAKVEWSRGLSLRFGAFAVTFLLFTVPLFGSRALGFAVEAQEQAQEQVRSLAQPEKTTEKPTEKPTEAPPEAQLEVRTDSRAEGFARPEALPVTLPAAHLDKQAAAQPEIQQALQPPTPSAVASDADSASIAREAGLQKLSTLKGLPCLRDLDQDECMLTYAYRAIEFHAIGEEVIARFQRLNGTVNDADVIVMSSHIEDAALNDRINLDESPVIFAQFQQLSGAKYEIPKTASEIKRSLGFSEDTPIAAVDWFEILKVHLERTLSTTPTVSDLILDLLGVELNPVVVETN